MACFASLIYKSESSGGPKPGEGVPGRGVRNSGLGIGGSGAGVLLPTGAPQTVQKLDASSTDAPQALQRPVSPGPLESPTGTAAFRKWVCFTFHRMTCTGTQSP